MQLRPSFYLFLFEIKLYQVFPLKKLKLYT